MRVRERGRARSSSRGALRRYLSLEPTELRRLRRRGGLSTFRIEFRGRGTRLDALTCRLHNAGGNCGGGVQRRREDVKIIVALQELGGVGRTLSASDPGPGIRHPVALDHRRGPGGARRRAPQKPFLVRRHGTHVTARVNTTCVQPDESFETEQAEVEEVVRGRVVVRPWLREHTPAVHVEARTSTLLPGRSTCRSTIRQSRRWPAASRPRPSNSTPPGFGRSDRLAWYGERNLPWIICGGPGRLAHATIPPMITWTPTASPGGEGVANARRLVRLTRTPSRNVRS